MGITYNAAKVGSLVTAKEFGARGDGVTDDTAAIQAAVNSSKSVYLPAGTYRVVGQILLPAGAALVGDEAILFCDPATTYSGCVRVQSGCKVEGIYFKGNNTSTDTSEEVGNSQLGAAIRGYDVENVLITNCRFSHFVLPSVSGMAIIGFNKSSKITVSGNYFDVTNTGGIEVNFGYRCWGTIVSDNQSYSDSDIFVSITSVGSDDEITGTEISITSHHVISNNIHIKRAGKTVPTGRHGVLVHYGGGISHAVITGNIIANTKRHGIYLRGAHTIGGNTGPSIVSNNIIRYCGGFAGSPNESPGYQSGIKVESTDGLICCQNLIEKCGYETDGTARNGQSGGIEIVRAVRHAVLSQNVIKDINGVGITLYPTVPVATGGTNLENLDVSHNQVRGCTHGSIVVSTYLGGELDAPAKNIRVSYNIAEISRADHAAISISTTRSGGDCPDTQIIGNMVYGVGNNSGRIGIAVDTFGDPSYTIANNVFNDLDKGLAFAVGFALGATGVVYTSHRAVGRDVSVEANTFKNCTTSVAVDFGQANCLCVIGESNQFISSSLPDRTTNGWNKKVLGRRGGYDASGNRLLQFYATELPTSQQYYQGDRLINADPSAGGIAEWVCVVAGTPGTWQVKAVEAIA